MSVGGALVARQKAGVTKRNKEIWSDEYTHYCDCGDGFTRMHILWKCSYWKSPSFSGGKEVIHTNNRYRFVTAKQGTSSVSIIATLLGL